MVFKESKKQPIKLRGYNYIGQHPDYEEVYYYIKPIGNDNYEFMEAKLAKNKRKYELAAGTTIKVIDSFMFNCLRAELLGITFENKEEFIRYVYDSSFRKSELSEEEFVNKYTAKIPNEIKTKEIFKQAKADGFDVLYCGKSLQEKKFETYSVVLVKKESFDFFGMKREYTRFKSLLYMTKPSYIKDKGVEQFAEFPQSDLNIIHDILDK